MQEATLLEIHCLQTWHELIGDKAKYLAGEPSHCTEYLKGYFQVSIMYLHVRPLLERVSIS